MIIIIKKKIHKQHLPVTAILQHNDITNFLKSGSARADQAEMDV